MAATQIVVLRFCRNLLVAIFSTWYARIHVFMALLYRMDMRVKMETVGMNLIMVAEAFAEHTIIVYFWTTNQEAVVGAILRYSTIVCWLGIMQ